MSKSRAGSRNTSSQSWHTFYEPDLLVTQITTTIGTFLESPKTSIDTYFPVFLTDLQCKDRLFLSRPSL